MITVKPQQPPEPAPAFGDTSDQQLTGKNDEPTTMSELQALPVGGPIARYSISTGARWYAPSGIANAGSVEAEIREGVRK